MEKRRRACAWPDAVLCLQECGGEEDVQVVRWRSVPVSSQADQRGGAQERYEHGRLLLHLDVISSVFFKWPSRNDKVQEGEQGNTQESLTFLMINDAIYNKSGPRKGDTVPRTFSIQIFSIIRNTSSTIYA